MQEYEYNINRASQTMTLLGNPTRLKILCHLFESEMNVTQLATLLKISQSSLSQQLAKLRAYRLVKTRRNAQTIYYSLAGEEAATLLGCLHQLYCNGEPDMWLQENTETSA